MPFFFGGQSWDEGVKKDAVLQCDSANDSDSEICVQFRLPRIGWTVLELAFEHAGPSSGVQVYFDSASDRVDQKPVYLPVRPGRTTKRVCYLPVMVRAIRMVPLGFVGEAGLQHIRFYWVSPRAARGYLSQRLVDQHHLYRDRNKSEVLKLIRGEARKNSQHWRELALTRYDETFARHCLKRDYHRWIESTEKPPTPRDAEGEGLIASYPVNPVISILLRTGKCKQRFLEQCVDAILGQSYPHWELNLPDAVSYRKLVECDQRIHGTSTPTVGTAGEINLALAQMSGEFIILMSEDDILAPNSLLKVAQILNERPGVRLLYSDEDKIDDEGSRFDPHFKPGWNPDLLLSQNYISSLVVFNAELIHSVDRLKEDMEGCEDYDLLLRCINRLQDDEIVHIPEILYHCRMSDDPAAPSQEEMQSSTRVGVRALRHYFERKECGVSVEAGLLPNCFRHRWPISVPPLLVSIIIPTKNNFEILERCINSILEKTAYEHYEILIIDNQSDCSETLSYLESISEEDRVSVQPWDYPFNYSSINNFGVEKTGGSILAFLNNDVEVINPEWLDEMVSQACREEIGCVGAKLYYPNDTVQHAGVILGIGGVAGHSHKYFSRNNPGYFSRLKLVQNLSAVTGACMVLRRSVFEEVGGLDENLAVAFNDVDFCLRVREVGYRNLWTPYAELYHHESMTRGPNDTGLKRKRIRREAEYMRKRWGKALDQDPAYNPNLTLVYEDFSLK